MTDDKKKDDPDRKKVSDEEMEDVAGGVRGSVTVNVTDDDGTIMHKSKKRGQGGMGYFSKGLHNNG